VDGSGKEESKGDRMKSVGRRKAEGANGKKGGEKWLMFSGRYNPSIVIDTMNGRGSIPREV
jgi:hypothetical protein